MKMKTIFTILFLMLFAATACFGAEEEVKKPDALAVGDVFEFEPVLDGDEVIHNFVIRNTGNAELQIERVQTGWGCTAASFTKQIPPGGEGKIEIKVNTSGFGGRKLSKNITVFTNDPAKRQLKLTIQGAVTRFVSINPSRIRMTGQAGQEIISKVTVIPQEKYPFKVLEVRTEKEDNIRVEMETVQKEQGTEYVLTIVNLKQMKSRYVDNVILKTDSPLKPELKINVYGNIFDPKPHTEKKG